MTQRQYGRPKDLTYLTDMRILLVCAALAVGILIVDITSLPLGVAVGVAYVAVVLISLSLSQWKFSLLVAGGVSVLTVLGFLFSEPAGIGWMVIANRVLALSVIWVTVVVGGWLVFSRRKQLVQNLTEAEEAADRARSAKSRFLESTSNDMRQNLQTLSLLSAAMRRSVMGSKSQDICDKQDAAVARLSDLLNSILEFCKLESGDVEPELVEVSIQEVFRQLHGEFGPVARTKGLQLRFSPESETAITDRTLLTQILRSLVSNALRYTDEGEVDVSCQRETDRLRFAVRDSGIGIARDKLNRIFDEFYRVDSNPVGGNGGRGLGLSIVDRGLKLLRSKIDVESDPGSGSTFTFVVPAGR